MEMWKDGSLTWEALRFLAKENQDRLRKAQEIIGPPWQGVMIGPKGAELMPKP